MFFLAFFLCVASKSSSLEQGRAGNLFVRPLQVVNKKAATA